MIKRRINHYSLNKRTEDIVYHYSNNEEDRYKKTDKGVLLVHIDKKGSITERLLNEQEFPLSVFDWMKKVSDADYKERNKADTLEYRHTVSLTGLNETKICSHNLSAEDEYLESIDIEIEDDQKDDFRTLENALIILKRCLTEKQMRRFWSYHYFGRTEREIAVSEGVSQAAIHYNIESCEKKIKKFFMKP